MTHAANMSPMDSVPATSNLCMFFVIRTSGRMTVPAPSNDVWTETSFDARNTEIR